MERNLKPFYYIMVLILQQIIKQKINFIFKIVKIINNLIGVIDNFYISAGDKLNLKFENLYKKIKVKKLKINSETLKRIECGR